jgi:hypothetical protein
MAAIGRKGAKARPGYGRQLFCLAAVLTVLAGLVGSAELVVYGLFTSFVLGVVCVFDLSFCPHCRTPRRRAASVCWACGRDYVGSETAHRRRRGALP